jgi:hypothetical protein
MIVGPALKAPAVVARLHNIAMMSEAIEQRCCHFGITKDTRPFAEAEVGGDND